MDYFFQYGFSPFVRYYLLPSGKSVNIFTEAAYGWTKGDEQGGTSTSHQWSLSAGPTFFLNPHVAIEVALNYTNTAGHLYTYGNPESLGISIGFQIHLGK